MIETMTRAEAGQVAAEAAEIYEAFFVPALFGQFAPQVCDAGAVRSGMRVADVACGTGVVAREAQSRGAEVTGIDVNAGMLAVAERREPGIRWVEGRAEALPLGDGSVDAALCQFALMFFADRQAALGELRRVVRPGGRAVVAVWDAAERSPGYDRMISLIEREVGGDAADALRAPFALGDPGELRELLASGGWSEAEVRTVPGTARFASIADWVKTDVYGWTLADLIDADGFARLSAAAERDLADLADAEGRVHFSAPAHLATLAL